MTRNLLLLMLAGLVACVPEHQAGQASPDVRVVNSEVPARALQRVLWIVRTQATRASDVEITIFVDASAASDTDTVPALPLPDTYRRMIAAEPGFAVVPTERLCPGELRIVLAGALPQSDSTFLITLDEYDLRPHSRMVWNQSYRVVCNEDYCEVTDIHLGEEPDISINFADPQVCEARLQE